MAPLDIPRISNQCALKRKLVRERVRVGITTLRRAYRLCGHSAWAIIQTDRSVERVFADGSDGSRRLLHVAGGVVR